MSTQKDWLACIPSYSPDVLPGARNHKMHYNQYAGKRKNTLILNTPIAYTCSIKTHISYLHYFSRERRVPDYFFMYKIIKSFKFEKPFVTSRIRSSYCSLDSCGIIKTSKEITRWVQVANDKYKLYCGGMKYSRISAMLSRWFLATMCKRVVAAITQTRRNVRVSGSF